MRDRVSWAIGLLVAAALPAFAEDGAEAPKPLVARGKLSRPLAAGDRIPRVIVLRSSPLTPCPVSVRVDGTELIATLDRPWEGAGVVHVEIGRGETAFHVLAVQDHLAGNLDLGTLPLDGGTNVLVAGNAVGGDGKPAAWATLDAGVAPADWSHYRFASTVADAQGAFSIRGVVTGGVPAIVVGGGGSWTTLAVAEVAPGARDAKPVVDLRPGLTGTLDLPVGLDPHHVELVVLDLTEESHELDVDGSSWYRRHGETMRIGLEAPRFRVSGLAPGRYRIGVRFPSARRWLVEPRAFVVASAPLVIEPLRVRGALRTVAAHVRTADGAVAPGSRIFAREQGDEGAWRELAVGSEGDTAVPTFSEELSLVATHDGGDFVFVSTKEGDATLVPPPAAPIPVTVEQESMRPAPEAKPEGTIELAWCAPIDGSPTPSDVEVLDPRRVASAETALPAKWPAVMAVPIPGWYRVSVRIGRSTHFITQYFGAVRVDGKSPATATVRISDVATSVPWARASREQHAGGLRGTVVLPDGLSLRDLAIVVAGPGAGQASVRGSRHSSSRPDVLEFDARSEFVIESLAPGSYDVRVKFRGSSRWLTRVQDVAVAASMVDLEALVVTAPIRRVSVRLVVPDGVDPSTVKLWARDGGDRGKHRSVTVEADGIAEVASVGDEVQLVAQAEGARFAFLVTSATDATLSLVPAKPVRVSVAIPAGQQARAASTQASVELKWIGGPVADRSQAERDTDDTDPRSKICVSALITAEGPVAIDVQEPGWYQIRYRTASGASTYQSGNVVLVDGSGPVGATLDVISPPDGR